jgi:PAS domain S-box-containing protein
VFSLDLETGFLECDARTAHIHGHSSLSQTIKEGRRFVHADDRVCIDARFGEAQSVRSAWSAEYRVVHPPGHPHAGEVRWVAFEGAIVPGVQGKPGRLLGISRDITDRKLAEQALAERDAQLALAGKIALVGNLTFNLSSGHMQVSPGYAAIHGLPEGTSETNRADWRARVHPDDLPRLDAHLRRDIDARRSEHYCDYRIFRSGGEIRWIEARSFILYDSDGTAQRIVGTNIDVTERKKAELALAERTLQLVLAEKTSMVGTVAYDVDAEKMQISEGYAAVHDFPEGTTEITRSEWQTRVHPEDAPRLEAVRGRAFGNRVNEYSADYRIVRPGGDIRWIEARSFVSYRGDCPQRVVGINIDITERKRTEQALAERNAQFELAHKAARVGSYAYDNTKHVMRLSRSSAAIYGLSQDTIEITGKDWHTCIQRDDVDRLRAERRRAFETQQPELVGEFRIVRPGGEIRWIEARSLISYDSAGRAARMVGVYIDVTDRMRVERALLERDAQLDLANQVGRVGGYSYDHATNTLRLGAGTAAIYGLPESTEEMTA